MHYVAMGKTVRGSILMPWFVLQAEVLFEIAYGGESLEKLFSAVSATTMYVMTKLIPEYLYLALRRFDVTDVTSDHYFYAGARIVQHINQGRHVPNSFSKIFCSLWQDVQYSCMSLDYLLFGPFSVRCVLKFEREKKQWTFFGRFQASATK